VSGNKEEIRYDKNGKRLGPQAFKPGQSGNPNGRPKGTATYLREKTDNLQTVLQQLIKLAESGADHVKIKAIQTILDRAEGKPVQQVDAKIDGGITFKWEDSDESQQ